MPDDAVGACDPVPADPVLDMTAAGTSASGTWGATTPAKVSAVRQILAPGIPYRVNISVVVASGSYTSAGAPAGYTHSLTSAGPNHLILQLRIFRVNPPDCDKDDLRCTMNARVVLQPGSGFDGTLPGVDPGETSKLVFTSNVPGGTNLIPVGSCDADLGSMATQPLSGELVVEF